MTFVSFRLNSIDATKDQLVECEIAMDFFDSVLEYGQNGYRSLEHLKVVLAATETVINILEKTEAIAGACKDELNEKTTKYCASDLEDNWTKLTEKIRIWFCKNQSTVFLNVSLGTQRVSLNDIREIEVRLNFVYLVYKCFIVYCI